MDFNTKPAKVISGAYWYQDYFDITIVSKSNDCWLEIRARQNWPYIPVAGKSVFHFPSWDDYLEDKEDKKDKRNPTGVLTETLITTLTSTLPSTLASRADTLAEDYANLLSILMDKQSM